MNRDSSSLKNSYLSLLEAESIHIFRECVAQFENPILLYSVGKDSSVLLHLARKAFYPEKIPFRALHVDTKFKFPEMYEFRGTAAQRYGVDLVTYSNDEAIETNVNPFTQDVQTCCGALKTQGLLQALRKFEVDAAIGGARREEESSRAKERIFSFRDKFGQWEPRSQRPELWSIYNTKLKKGESMRVFPLSNWTELDIWQYIAQEEIPVVPIYFAQHREVIVRKGQLIPNLAPFNPLPGEKVEVVECRFRTLGCTPCTGAIRSSAKNVAEIIDELFHSNSSERGTRLIDHDIKHSMEVKKKEGYF